MHSESYACPTAKSGHSERSNVTCSDFVSAEYLINPVKPHVLFVGHRQTVQNHTRCHVLRHLIRFFIVYSKNVQLEFE